MDEETLFKSPEVFTPAYVPEDFMHRDAQLSEISYSLKPGLKGVNPVNTLVYGPAGVGKTTAVKIMFDEVKKSSQMLVPVYVNCMDQHTRFSVFSKIHEAVFGHSPPDTGKPLNAIKEKVFNKLSREGKSLVVCLDEVDTLFLDKSAENVLIDLLKAHGSYGYDKVGVIGILIDKSIIAKLDDKTRSVFNPTEIEFGAYSESELRDILGQRAKYGFYDSVLPDEVLDQIVSATHDAGDLRYGLEIMRRSGLQAEKDSSRNIKAGHVEAAMERAYDFRKEKLGETLDPVGEALIEILREKGDLRTGQLYELARKKTRVGVKKYNQLISKLEHHKIIQTKPVEGRGRSRLISLKKK